MAWSISDDNSTEVIGPIPLLSKSIFFEAGIFSAVLVALVSVGAFFS